MVKFNQYLEKNKLLSWSQQYLNYYQLKTYLKEGELSHFDRLLNQEADKVDRFYQMQIDRLNSDSEQIDDCYETADQLRQYLLLNIIGFIKIIKKRNKNVNHDDTLSENTPILSAKELLEKYRFYQCRELHDKFAELIDTANQENTQMLQEHFENSNSFRILQNYHLFQPSFSFFSDLPFCDTDFI